MSARFSWESLPENLDLQMLQNAKACLRCLHANQTPSDMQNQAFRCLHATYGPVVRSFVIGYGVPTNDIEDCCQEVWQDIHMNLSAIQSDGSQSRFCSWLKTIAHSKVIDFLRDRLRHPTKRLCHQAEAALPSRDGDSLDDCKRQEVVETVHRVLAVMRRQVSGISFRVFWMRAIEERTIEEVAAELHLKVPQVRVRLCRAKKRFRYWWERLTTDETYRDCQA